MEKYSKSTKWDCGSTLYDSYELNSFKRQIESAIANSPRTHSMPHLPQRTLQFQVQPQPQNHHEPTSSLVINNKSTFKISRTFQKLVRFVFKSSANKSNKVNSSSSYSNSFRSYPKDQEQRLCMVYEKYESEPILLSTIPELPDFEIAGLSPDISNFVRKSSSERFTAPANIGISCA